MKEKGKTTYCNWKLLPLVERLSKKLGNELNDAIVGQE
jgi:hypothetical protein